jgi:Tetratricopeptide repeat
VHAKLITMLATGVLICGLITASNVCAAEPGIQAFDRGAAEFHAGDYPGALADFLKARREGIQNPQLGYDLGVTYYHLARFDEARREFIALTALPSVAALSHYNLGLIALQQHDKPGARKEFKRALASAQTPELHALAAAALDNLGPEPTHNPRWTTFANAGFGYDSNVALTSESTTLTPAQQGSDVYSLLAGAIAQLSGSGAQGWQAVGTFYRLDYPKLGQYDQSYLHLGGQYRWRTGDWGHMFGFYAGEVTLGSANLESLATFSADTRYAYPSGTTLHAFYRYTRIKGSSDYDYLTGWHQSIGVEDTLQMPRVDLTLGYSFDFNERNNYNSPSQFLSSSPTVNGVYALYNWHMDDAMTLHLEADYQHSHYQESNTTTQGSTVTSILREDNWWSSAIGLSYSLDTSWSLRLNWSFSDNRSNISQYSYNSKQIMASLEYVMSH